MPRVWSWERPFRSNTEKRAVACGRWSGALYSGSCDESILTPASQRCVPGVPSPQQRRNKKKWVRLQKCRDGWHERTLYARGFVQKAGTQTMTVPPFKKRKYSFLEGQCKGGRCRAEGKQPYSRWGSRRKRLKWDGWPLGRKSGLDAGARGAKPKGGGGRGRKAK